MSLLFSPSSMTLDNAPLKKPRINDEDPTGQVAPEGEYECSTPAIALQQQQLVISTRRGGGGGGKGLSIPLALPREEVSELYRVCNPCAIPPHLDPISLSSSSLTMSPSRSMPDVTKSEEVSLPFPRIRTSYGENSIPADFHHREAFVTRMNRTRPDSLDRVSNPESSRARKSGMLAPPMSAKSARRSKHEKFDQSGWSPSPLPSFRNNF